MSTPAEPAAAPARPSRMAVLAASLGGLAVIAGAFGAHGLKAMLSEQALAWWHTGAQYHLVHALVLLVAATVPATRPKARALANGALVAGIAIFSGSLYVMALTGVTALGAVTPIGGVGLIVGWFALAFSFFPPKR